MCVIQKLKLDAPSDEIISTKENINILGYSKHNKSFFNKFPMGTAVYNLQVMGRVAESFLKPGERRKGNLQVTHGPNAEFH
jgi:hypothetical protein